MSFGSKFSFSIITGVIRIVFQRFRFFNNLSNSKITSCLNLGLLICFGTMLLCTVSDCTESFNLHWNTSNPIFRVDNTDNIISVNGNTQFDYDQVNIICPVYWPGTRDTEKYIIYNVSKEEYETCHITNLNPRIMAVCDKPNKLMYYTITFMSFSPHPAGLEFPPGQDYYFISTSSKNDLHGRIGGRCASNNMKIIIRVCCPPEDTPHNHSVRHNAVPTNSSSSMTTDRSSSSTEVQLTTEKSPEYSPQPNEVDNKNKELTQHGRDSSSPLYSISPKHKLLATIIIGLVPFLI